MRANWLRFKEKQNDKIRRKNVSNVSRKMQNYEDVPSQDLECSLFIKTKLLPTNFFIIYNMRREKT